MAGNTVRLHRVLRAKPQKVYRAFVEKDALARRTRCRRTVLPAMSNLLWAKC